MLPSSTSSSSSSTSTRGNTRKRKRPVWRNNDNDSNDNAILLLEEMKDVDFEELATKYPDFAKEWKLVKLQKQKKSQSFSSFVTIQFNRALTRAILHSRFNLVLPCLPEGRLVPPVPNRLWYVQWIKFHLLPLLSNTDHFQQSKESTITTAIVPRQITSRCCCLRGIDIGTGASCIYPLLVCGGTCAYCTGGGDKENSSYQTSCECQMVATEVDPISVESAKENINANKLDRQIQVILVKPTNVQQQQQQQQQQVEQVTQGAQGTDPTSTPLSARTRVTKDVCHKNKGPIAHAMKSISSSHHEKGGSMSDTNGNACQATPLSFDFVMTNPPFYDDSESTERTDARAGDDRARVPMTVHEGSYPGGEVGFVVDMVRDSLSLRNSISWYTAMFGKKASFLKVKRILSRLLSPGNLQMTEFGPGKMTRWFLAWTFHQPTRTNPSSRIGGGLQKFEVKNVEQSATIKTMKEAVDEIVNRICTHCQAIIPQAVVECQNPTTGTVSSLNGCYTKIITVQHKGSSHASSNISHHESGSTAQSSSPLDVSLFPQRIFCKDNKGDVAEFKRTLLKEVGNFQIDFTVSPNESALAAKANTDSHENHEATCSFTATDATNKHFSVVVNLACFSHSIQGTEMIDKIRRQLVGEVSRTNRRWRRRKQKSEENSFSQPQEL